MTRQQIDQICETQGYAAAKAAADKAGIIWFASAGLAPAIARHRKAFDARVETDLRQDRPGWEREFWKLLSPEVVV